MTAALDVLGHLTILADGGRPLRVEFRGDVVALEIPALRAALALRGRMRRLERRAPRGEQSRAIPSGFGFLVVSRRECEAAGMALRGSGARSQLPSVLFFYFFFETDYQGRGSPPTFIRMARVSP